MDYKKDLRSELVFVNLDGNWHLSEANQTALADLIYNTDPFIYPAMFGSKENAEAVLPLLFYSRDEMFRLDNFFTAMHNDKIIGLLLWTQGRMNWSSDLLKSAANRIGVQPSPFLEQVAQEYVGRYSAQDKSELISIINLSVLEDYRSNGVGRMLMESFAAVHPHITLELCVLKDNHTALRLYESLGFETIEEYNGFSVDHRHLDAVCMQRRVSP